MTLVKPLPESESKRQSKANRPHFIFCDGGIIFNNITLVLGFWWGGVREEHLEDPGVDGWIFRKWDVGV